jgi:DNA-binding GntR family transcriptional regulator
MDSLKSRQADEKKRVLLFRQDALTDADKAYLELKERIITIRMRPGSVIRESHLIDELNLGRTPIREALVRLQADKLVVANPRRGMYVTEIALTDLGKITEVRIELESLCASLATNRITPEQLDELRQMVADYWQTDKQDLTELLHFDRRFHELLSRAAHNSFLSRELEQYHNLTLRIWHLAINNLTREDLNIEAFPKILVAIEDQDCWESHRIMRTHVETFYESIRRYL